MLIQCRESLFKEICDLLEKKPYITTDPNRGTVDVFYRDWLFLQVNSDKVYNHVVKSKEQYLLVKDNVMMSHNVAENERFIYCRKIEGEHQILNGWKSYIKWR